MSAPMLDQTDILANFESLLVLLRFVMCLEGVLCDEIACTRDAVVLASPRLVLVDWLVQKLVHVLRE